MPQVYSGSQYWIGNFKTLLNGMLKQVEQLPKGERQKQVKQHLEGCVDIIESLERDSRPDADLNFSLFSLPSVGRSGEEEHAAHV